MIEELRKIVRALEVADLEKERQLMEKDLEIIRLKRGNETLQEVIKMKDDVYQELITSLKPPKKDK